MNTPVDFLESYKLEGEKLKVITYPAPVLKKKSVLVENFDPALKKLVKDMLFTMYLAPGIGLAAPQVGESLRVFVMDIDYKREKVTAADGKITSNLSKFNPMVFINPIIKKKKGEILYEEGCLSVPGVYEKVKRAEEIIVEYQDLNGESKTLEAHSTLSVCIQHENDHLDGIVFLERLSLMKRKLLTKKYLKHKDD